jgi:hypothetical protein
MGETIVISYFVSKTTIRVFSPLSIRRDTASSSSCSSCRALHSVALPADSRVSYFQVRSGAAGFSAEVH